MDRIRRTLTIAIFICLMAAEPSAAGSCKAAKLCCQGRDSGCVIQKASPNAIIETPRDKPCYCDHACLRLGDCCDDFNETCTVGDCSVSDWSSWSECDNGCGSGLQTRSRFVVRPSRNGGKACPEIEEVRSCQNYDACRRRAHHFQVQEAIFSSENSSSSSSGGGGGGGRGGGGGGAVTSDSNFVPQVTNGYCAAFTILKISRGCRRRLESFHEGSRVCVYCPDAKAQSSSSCQLDNLLHQITYLGIGRWELSNSSIVKHCHGKWIGEPAHGLIRQNDCWAHPVCKDRAMLAFL